MKLVRLVYLGLVLAGAAGVLNAQTDTPVSGAGADPPPQVVVADVTGVIGPAQAGWVDQVLTRAGEQGAAAVLLRLDTPGGLTTSMRTIIQSVLSSPVPVIGWVGPSGSRAASAGTYILYGCHVAAMAPGTNLGAATPVQMGGGLPGSEEPDSEKEKGGEADGQEAPADAKERKAVEDAVAYIRSLAEMRGRNADWAERAVRQAASLSAEQAAGDNVIDFVAANEQAVLDGANGRQVETSAGTVTLALEGAVTETMEPGWRTRLLQILANPNVAYILMLIGIYGLIFELANPGAIVPGVIGGISLLLALYAFQTLPVNFAGLALIGLGILFFVGEALVPSFGALGVGGLIAFVLGSVMLMDTDVPALEIAWPVIVTASLVTGAFILAVATMAARGHRRQPVSGSGHLVGHTAEVVEDLDPEGRVRFEGELWRARASRPAAKGDPVRIDALNGLTLEVSPTEDSARNEE